MRDHVDTQVIIQARMGSSRLPGKVLEEIAGYPALQHVIHRCKAASFVDRVVVATTERPDDKEIVDWCKRTDTYCVRGCAEDVLDRFVFACHEFPCRRIVRITADCPVIDPAIIDVAVALHKQDHWDYVTNVMKPHFPVGFAVEVLCTDILRLLRAETTLKSHREHVTLRIREQPKRFKIFNIPYGEDLSQYRLTLDYPEDLAALQKLYEFTPTLPTIPSLYELVRILKTNPEIVAINAGIDRYDGLRRSLNDEGRGMSLQEG